MLGEPDCELHLADGQVIETHVDLLLKYSSHLAPNLAELVLMND